MKRIGVRQYITCITLIPLIVITAFLEIFFIHNYFAQLDLHIVERGKLIAHQFEESSEYGVMSNNLLFLENIAKNISQESDVSGVLVFNSTSKILAEAGNSLNSLKKELADKQYTMVGKLPEVNRHGNRSILISQAIIPETVLLDEFEVEPAVKVIGAVIIEMSLVNTENLKSEILWYTLITTTIFLTIISYIVYLVSKSITNPVAILSNVIQKIAKGNLEARNVSSSHISELDVLSNGINYMAEQLQHEHVILQQRIDEATLDIRNSKEKAERANLAKSKFLAAASHDLRQPLHALGLFASALNERIKSPDERLLIENINQSVSSLEELFNALLDISRLDAGIIQPKFQHFWIMGLMDKLFTEFKAQARRKGLNMQLDGADVVIYSDQILLETMLRNLIGNAIRYTQSGEVKVAWLIDGSKVCIEVRDTGVGISDDDKVHIFQEFLQLNNPERDRTKGLGLGLAIVRRLSGLLKSTISVQSTIGLGSVFRLDIPLGDASMIADNDSLVMQFMENEPAMLVLVIDDEPSVRTAMTGLLNTWGHEVIVVDSLSEALQATNRPPDVIIADYRLANEQTGIEAIKGIQQLWGREIPSLIVTGDTAPERLREAQSSGYAFMHKPVNSAKLRAFLRSVSRRIS